nr:uncharacterized protein zgc:113184 isoform X2 [Nothobranchius furzeri]
MVACDGVKAASAEACLHSYEEFRSCRLSFYHWSRLCCLFLNIAGSLGDILAQLEKILTSALQISRWDGGSVQPTVSAVSQPEVPLSEAGSAAASAHNRSAETARCACSYWRGKVPTAEGCRTMPSRSPLQKNPSRYLGASSIKLKSDENPPVEDKAQRTARMPMTGCSYQVDDLLNQAGAAMMSDVVLHSHVCEFCQAVFPGDSTTSGEFLRHLHTHIT